MAKKSKEDAADEARAKRLEKICETINKGAFGGDKKDAVTWLGSRDAIALERFPSGCLALDDALGGGWPKGRFIEIYGPESAGKSTVVLHAIAEHQKKYPDEDCALIDLEFSFDEEYAQSLGVNTKYLIVHQPDSGEQALNILNQLILAGVRCFAFDCVAALTTKAELDGDLGDTHVGEQARLMSQSLRRLAAEAGKRNATVLFTNQVREKIGISYGDKTTTPAGRALRHWASIRVHVRATGRVKENIGGEEVVVSSTHIADVKKNKTAAPFKKAEFVISFGHGIDTIAAILDSAMSLGIIVKRGSWISMDNQQLGQGRAVVLDMLRKDAEFRQKVTEAIAAKKAAGAVEVVPADVVVDNTPAANDDPDTVGAAEEAEEAATEVADA